MRANLRFRWLALVALSLSTVIPVLLLALWSVEREWFFPALLPDGLTWAGWRAVVGGSRLPAALGTSIGLGVGTGALAAMFALPVGRALAELAGWRRHLGAALAFFPVAAPPLALGTGLQVTFLQAGLGGSWTGVLLAHAVPATGYATLYFLGVFAAFDRRIEEEARSLGATPRQTLLHVTLPLLRRPLGDAFALGFLVSWAQVPLTLLIGGGSVRTLPIEVFAFVQAGQDRLAATGALLLIAPAVAALAVARLGAARTAVPAV